MSFEDTRAERDLWRKVILQALTDIKCISTTGSALLEAKVARDWFTNGGRDFRDVCEMADMDPGHVQKCALETIREIDAERFERRSSASARRGPRGKTLTFDGQTMTVAKWANKRGMGVGTLYGRLAQGWSTEDALLTPVRIKIDKPLGKARPNPAFAANGRVALLYEVDGEQKSIDDWCNIYGIHRSTVESRMRKMPLEEALKRPVRALERFPRRREPGGRVETSPDQLRTGAVPTAHDSHQIGFF